MLPELAAPALLFVGSRLMTWLVAFPLHYVDTRGHDRAMFTGWEGHAFIALARDGYTGMETNPHFPGYPWAVDGMAWLTGLPTREAAVVTTVLAGLVATVAVYMLARRFGGRRPATRATALFTFLPGAYVLSMAYPDALFTAGAAVCLAALAGRRWATAGVAAALTGMVDPRAAVLVACCAAAAVPEVWKTRAPYPLAALALSPIGLEAGYAYLESDPATTGVWGRAFGDTWRNIFDLVLSFPGDVAEWLGDPMADMNVAMALLALAAAVAGLVLLLRRRVPLPLVLFSAAMVLAAFVQPRGEGAFRLLVAAFPLCVAYGRSVSEEVHPAVVATSAGLMSALLVMTYITTAFPP